ncbi:hypothetical protein [Rarobacter incanus]|nr:hypothetical protein [Rarobacter incanus]
MNARTKKLAAAGVLALTLPLAPTAQAAVVSRADSLGIASAGVTGGALIESDPAADADAKSDTIRRAAIDDAAAAIARADLALAMMGDVDTAAWHAETVAQEASLGLLAAQAHVTFALGEVNAASQSRLTEISAQLTDMTQRLESVSQTA